MGGNLVTPLIESVLTFTSTSEKIQNSFSKVMGDDSLNHCDFNKTNKKYETLSNCSTNSEIFDVSFLNVLLLSFYPEF